MVIFSQYKVIYIPITQIKNIMYNGMHPKERENINIYYEIQPKKKDKKINKVYYFLGSYGPSETKMLSY